MKPSERILQILKTIPFELRDTLPGTIQSMIQYLDEEWEKTHCEIPPSTEPGKLHDCSKIHVKPSSNAQPQQQ